MRINISDMMDHTRDDTVSLREAENADAARITALTMAKIRKDEARSGRSGRRLSRGAVAVLAAAVCLALSVTAAAVGIARSVNWQGEPVGETEAPRPTETPAEEERNAETAKAERISDILSRRGERECVIVRSEDGSASGAARSAPVASLEALRELLEREDSPLTVPFLAAPAGYTLRDGWVAYDSAAGYGYTLASTETTEDGLTVEHYTAPEEGDFISAYCLTYQNKDGEQLVFSAQMEGNGEHRFGVGEDSTVEALTLEGMDDALAIENGDGSNVIFMRKVFAAPVAYEKMFALMDESGAPWEPWEYTEAVYRISGPLSPAELREYLLPAAS